MTLILVLLFIITVGLGIGLCVLHPLACMRACYLRADFVPKQKVVWIALIVLTCPIGSLVYTFWRQTNSRFREVTLQLLASFTLALVLLVATSYAIPTPADHFLSAPLTLQH